MEDKKVLLSVKDLYVKFKVRGRILTAIRGVSLDIYEDESIAIVGESGSGKSVFTKTFAGMNDSNAFIPQGEIVFSDPDLANRVVVNDNDAKTAIFKYLTMLNSFAKMENGADIYKQMLDLESEKRSREKLTDEEKQAIEDHIKELKAESVDLFNLKQTYDSSTEKEAIRETKDKIKAIQAQIKDAEKNAVNAEKQKAKNAKEDTVYNQQYTEKMNALKQKYEEKTSQPISNAQEERNAILAREVYLSTCEYKRRNQKKAADAILESLRKAMQLGVELNEQTRNQLFGETTFRVRFEEETANELKGTCILNLANVKDDGDWSKIRGKKIAFVFQDPMTSLNPIITIGQQITSIILKHQNVSEAEARKKALELMYKVGIPNAEHRFDDYPFQYSGGMRQRIVIAIALSCQPKILICDEPTTALDVTIQAQILKLIKELQKEFHYTIVFITHDLGVVANIADRVAVLYGGQIVELGTVEEVFYDPRHPYTWALLSSLPQLAQRNTKLYSITGTPPSLYNKIVGDAFAPRNPYCIKIDTLLEPPMFKVTETHYAKTWLLDPRAPKFEKPEQIQDIHQKLIDSFNI